MADSKKTEKSEETETDAAAGGKKSSSMMLIIIIVVLILVILVGAIVAVLMMGGDAKADGKDPQAVEKKVEDKSSSKNTSSESGGEGAQKLEDVGILFPMEPFTVNLLSDSGSHYLKATLSLSLSGKEMSEELEAKKAVLRDKILRILSSKSMDEVSTLKGKDKLSEQIMGEINPMLNDGKITGVYFTDFVIQ